MSQCNCCSSLAVGEGGRRQNPTVVANSPHSDQSLSPPQCPEQEWEELSPVPQCPTEISQYLCPSKAKSSPAKKVASCTFPRLGHFFCLLSISHYSLSMKETSGKNPNPQHLTKCLKIAPFMLVNAERGCFSSHPVLSQSLPPALQAELSDYIEHNILQRQQVISPKDFLWLVSVMQRWEI